jgi:phospholipase/carboxylesterase
MSTDTPLELATLELETQGPVRHSVIWLHGLGADGYDFEPVVAELGLPPDAGVRFVFPHAPSIPVTINGGMVMPAWYDILEMSLARRVDETQLRQSACQVGRLIEREIARGIPSENIVLAGFSQGGAVAIELALTFPQPLAGLIALSTYFATSSSTSLGPANRLLPVFIGHGTQDPIVALALGQHCYETLFRQGLQPQYHTYPMEHAVCQQEIADISCWLCKWLLKV